MSDNISQNKNPYVGPRALEKGELLCGRDRELQELMDLLIAERIILLHSPSGAGKTSLLQAGLIPRLKDEGFDVLPIIRVSFDNNKNTNRKDGPNRYILSAILSVEDKDSSRPLESQAAEPSLKRFFQNRAEAAKQSYQPAETKDASEVLQLEKKELLDYLSSLARAKGDYDAEILIFDQFEEILTLDPTDDEVKKKFFEEVGELLRDRNRWAIFSMREDYVAALDPYLRYIPTRLSTNYRLDLLDKNAAYLSIQDPTRPYKEESTKGQDAYVFDKDAAEALIEDLQKVKIRKGATFSTEVGLYVEPVQLQVVCRRLWDVMYPVLIQLPASKRRITKENVLKVGNIDQALGEYYAGVVAEVSNGPTEMTERVIRNWFENEMITQQGIRNLVMQGETESKGLNNDAVKELIDGFLIRKEPRHGIIWLELAHDRLIEPILNNNKTWFETNMPGLERKAKIWRDNGYSTGHLLLGEALNEAELSYKDLQKDFNAQQRQLVEEFLKRSREFQNELARKAKFAKWVKYAACALFVLLIIAGVSLWGYAQKAKELEATNSELKRTNEKLKGKKQKVKDKKRRLEDRKTELGEKEQIIAETTGLLDGVKDELDKEKEAFKKAKADYEMEKKAAEAQFEAKLKDREVDFNNKLKERESIFNAKLKEREDESERKIRAATDRLEKQQKELDDLQEVAISNTMAATAEQELNSGLFYNLKLGQRYAVASNYNRTTQFSMQALIKALQLSPIQQSFFDTTKSSHFQATAFNPQSGRIVAVTEEGAINGGLNPAGDPPAQFEPPIEKKPVTTVAVSEAGNRVAIARPGVGKRQEVIIYDITSDGKAALLTTNEGHGRGTARLALSDDGTYVATANTFGNFAVTYIPAGQGSNQVKNRWSRPNWLTKWRVRFPKTPLGSETFRNVTAMAFTHKQSAQRRIFAVTFQTGEISFHDAETGKILLGPSKLPAYNRQSEITSISFDKDNTKMAIGSRDNNVWVYEIDRQSVTGSFNGSAPANAPLSLLYKGPLAGHSDDVISVAFNPEKEILATGSQDRTTILWDLSKTPVVSCPSNNPRKLIEISGHKGYVNSVSFSSNGELLVTGSADSTTKVWKIGSIEDLRKLKCLVDKLDEIKVEQTATPQTTTPVIKDYLRDAKKIIPGEPLSDNDCKTRWKHGCPKLD